MSMLPVLPDVFEEGMAVSYYADTRGAPDHKHVARRQHDRATDVEVLGGREAFSDVPISERSKAIACIRAAEFASDLREQGKCEKCALQLAYCICEKTSALAANIATSGIGQQIRFVIFMHVRERKRASNTGKLIEHVLPNSEVLLHDVQADAERFEKLVAETRPGAAFVLFPSADAVPVSQLLNSCVTKNETFSEQHRYNSAALAVLVDGTWRQARRMHKQLEALPRVALVPRARSEFTWRRQATEDRICTVEAAALLLEDLEEPQVAEALRKALGELCGALDRQSHIDTMMNGKKPIPVSKKPLPAHRLPKRDVF